MFVSRYQRCWFVGPHGASVGWASGRRPLVWAGGRVTRGGRGGRQDLGAAAGAPGSRNPPSQDRAPRCLWGRRRGGEQEKGTAPAGSGGPHHAGAGSVRGPGSAQGQVSGLRVPPTHLVHHVETWGSPRPSGGRWTGVQSDLSALAACLRDGGSRHLGGEALCFCELCALPASWTLVPSLRPLPASHRAGGRVD